MPWGVIKQTYTVPELKYKDVTATGILSGAGSFALLNPLNVGTSSTTRIGRNITIKKLHIKFNIVGSAFSFTPTSPAQSVRAIVLFDMQPNGALPAASDILEDATTGVQVVSSTALKYGSRFKILMDKRWVVNNQLSASQAPANYECFDEQYLNLNLKCTYANTNNGDVTDIETGALLLFLTSDTGTAADQPALQFYNRIRFTDN